MAWYEVILLIFIFGGFAVFAFYTEIKKVREYIRTEKAKREFMRSVEFSLIAIYKSLQKIAEIN